MLQWNELRITEDSKHLVIDVQVQNLDYYENVHLQSLYMNVYKKFKAKLQENYKLDYIGEIEVGQKKLEYEGNIAIVKRPDKGLLAGLWEFPSVSGHFSMPRVKEELAKKELVPITVKRLADSKHVFSHVEWNMKGYFISFEREPAQWASNLLWVARDELKETYAIPVAFHPFLRQIQETLLSTIIVKPHYIVMKKE